MVELRELPDGTLRRSWGGDTLNTALYLARLGAAVDNVTALGDDGWSSEMLAEWQSEGIGTGLVHRLPGRLPGLYIIQTDSRGERALSLLAGQRGGAAVVRASGRDRAGRVWRAVSLRHHALHL